MPKDTYLPLFSDPGEWFRSLQRSYLAQPDESLLDELTDIGRLMPVVDFPPEDIIDIHAAVLKEALANHGHPQAGEVIDQAALFLSTFLVSWRLAAEGTNTHRVREGDCRPLMLLWFSADGRVGPVHDTIPAELARVWAAPDLDTLFEALAIAHRLPTIKAAILGHRSLSVEFPHPTAPDRWLRATICPFRHSGGMIALADLTAQLADERQMRLASTVFQATQEGLAIMDADFRLVAVNPACCAMTGYADSELIGQYPHMLRSDRHDDAFYDDIAASLEKQGHWQGELWGTRRNGDPYPTWMTISTVRDRHALPANHVAAFIDISQVKQSALELEHLATHDALTGLPNRLMLASCLQHCVAAARRKRSRGALLFLDLDRFKNINDSFGHATGDELLQQVVERYRGRLRASDILCRMGGDEFVIILEDLSQPGDAAHVAATLIHALQTPFHLQQGRREVYVGVSIGISHFPSGNDDPEQLISQADAAMYQAKRAGRNTYRYYTRDLSINANAEIEGEAALRRALDREEFLLHFQPFIDGRQRRLTGVEALLRWQRPGHGLVRPGDFIPLAEETGLIVPIGAWVLHHACAQMQRWREAGLALDTLAVNLSAHQFNRPGLHDTVRSALATSGLPARYLELELTESALLDSAGGVQDKLMDLKSLGVRLSIDDFGTGYSSLAYLKHFPIDKLKIDHSFMRDIPQDGADAKIVAAIISLAHTLQLDVLAEGVESLHQLSYLMQQHCHLFQGYLFCQPMDAAALQAWLADPAHQSRLLHTLAAYGSEASASSQETPAGIRSRYA